MESEPTRAEDRETDTDLKIRELQLYFEQQKYRRRISFAFVILIFSFTTSIASYLFVEWNSKAEIQLEQLHKRVLTNNATIKKLLHETEQLRKNYDTTIDITLERNKELYREIMRTLDLINKVKDSAQKSKSQKAP